MPEVARDAGAVIVGWVTLSLLVVGAWVAFVWIARRHR